MLMHFYGYGASIDTSFLKYYWCEILCSGSFWDFHIFVCSYIILKACFSLSPIHHTCHFAAYTTFFILGLLLSMQVPFVGFQPIRTSEHMASAGNLLLTLCNATEGINMLCSCFVV